jgi:RNA polymerase-binding transcription factor DksA
MADEADLAQENVEALERTGIAAVTAKLDGEGTKYCIEEDCGIEIPALRREKMPSATRGIDCQTEYEKRAKHYAGPIKREPDYATEYQPEPEGDDEPAIQG